MLLKCIFGVFFKDNILKNINGKPNNLNQIIEELKITKVSERSGRPMGKDEDESSFERLRADGYL